MGFKPRSKLKIHHYVKPSNFIYPDETVSGGSGKGNNRENFHCYYYFIDSYWEYQAILCTSSEMHLKRNGCHLQVYSS